MRKILVIQHVAHEILGTLNPLLKERGFRIRYVNFGRDPDFVPSLQGYSGLILLGGPMGVYEVNKYPHLKEELRLIEEALKNELPILGICLGAQLIAHALGASVRRHANEVGWHQVNLTRDGKSNPLFSCYDSSEHLFQLHMDTFDLPQGVTHLARSNTCESQAFSYGKNVYGLQFHLEVDKDMVHRWLKIPAIQKTFLHPNVGAMSQNILKDTEQLMDRSLSLSQSTFGEFIDRSFNLHRKPVALKSDHGKPRKV